VYQCSIDLAPNNDNEEGEKTHEHKDTKGDHTAMPKAKTSISITTLTAILALSALTPTPASAKTPGWMINGTLLNGTKALAGTAKVDENAKLKSTAANIAIECTGGTIAEAGAEVKAPNTGAANSIEFTGCVALTPNCTLSSSTISSVPVTLEATLEGTLAVVGTFKPKTKATLATLEFTGTNCASQGLDAVAGTVKVLAPTGQDERTVQLNSSIATEASDELKVASSPASLTGSMLIQAATGEPWSFL
jgi:hypothetical protein